MNRRHDETGPISWQDALTMWNDVQVHYGVVLSIGNGFVRKGAQRSHFVLNLYYTKVTGTTDSKRIHFGPMEYPHPNYGTYPACLVHHLSKLCKRLEEAADREKAALAQTEMFREG